MKRIFSGIQPSGELHLGNYLGAIKNWAKLLVEYDCIFCIVDYHVITIEYDISQFQSRIFDAALVSQRAGAEATVPEVCDAAWAYLCEHAVR